MNGLKELYLEMNKKIKPDKSWTLFLDRDGVINKRPLNDYVRSVNQFEFLNSVPESISRLSNIFGLIFVVTNQQGIGKKLMTEKDLEKIHKFMCENIQQAGGKIDKIYHCPDLDKNGSKYRKPETGMGLKAKQDYPQINFEKSIMVGDTMQDMIFGKELNMFTVLLTEDIDYISSQKTKQWDMHFNSLNEFTEWIEKTTKN